MIKAVIFDMDGVLVAAKDWHYEALNRALALFSFEISREKHLTQYDGLPTYKKLEMLSEEEGLPKALHDLINEKKQSYTMDIIHEKCVPNAVHKHALFTLKARGYKLALASNSTRHSVDLIMHKTQLDIYLDELFSASDVLRPKPHPEIYNKAISTLKLSPDECLILEDNINGVKAARDSGAHLLIINEVSDVNLENIVARIQQIESIGYHHEAHYA